jgi:hypothetical protein
MLLATPLLLASSAYADKISIGFQEPGVHGGAIHTVGTGSGNVVIPGISYGTFTINDVNAQDFAVLGPPGLLNSQNLDISSSRPGILTIWITAQGLSFMGAQSFASSFAVNTLSGSIVAVEESTYFSPTNGLYNVGQTLLNSAAFIAIGTAGPFTTSGLTSGTYSVTEKYVIFDTGGSPGNDNVTIDLSASPVPEPGSLLLVGSGLALAGLLYYRRHNKRTVCCISIA